MIFIYIKNYKYIQCNYGIICILPHYKYIKPLAERNIKKLHPICFCVYLCISHPDFALFLHPKLSTYPMPICNNHGFLKLLFKILRISMGLLKSQVGGL